MVTRGQVIAQGMSLAALAFLRAGQLLETVMEVLHLPPVIHSTLRQIGAWSDWGHW